MLKSPIASKPGEAALHNPGEARDLERAKLSLLASFPYPLSIRIPPRPPTDYKDDLEPEQPVRSPTSGMLDSPIALSMNTGWISLIVRSLECFRFSTVLGQKRMVSLVVKFFDDARGSAFECAACLDASVAKGFVSIDRVRPGKEMLARVVAMLTRLNRSLRYKQSHVLIPPSPNRSSFSARFPVVRAKLPPLASFPLPSILRASLQSAPIRNRPRRRGRL